jgi:hypothetical protein
MGMFDKMAKKVMESAVEAAQNLGEGLNEASQRAAGGDAGDPPPSRGEDPPAATVPPSGHAVARNGLCPACGSATMHQAPEGRFSWHTGGSTAGGGKAVFVGTSRMVQASPVSTVVCSTCGYFQHFVDDPRRLAEVAANWERLPAAGG